MNITTIHGSEIVAAMKAETPSLRNKGVTRVWCEDGSLHLVIGYGYRLRKDNEGKSRCHLISYFNTIVGYWDIPEGQSYLSSECNEVITRPSFLN